MIHQQRRKCQKFALTTLSVRRTITSASVNTSYLYFHGEGEKAGHGDLQNHSPRKHGHATGFVLYSPNLTRALQLSFFSNNYQYCSVIPPRKPFALNLVGGGCWVGERKKKKSWLTFNHLLDWSSSSQSLIQLSLVLSSDCYDQACNGILPRSIPSDRLKCHSRMCCIPVQPPAFTKACSACQTPLLNGSQANTKGQAEPAPLPYETSY